MNLDFVDSYTAGILVLDFVIVFVVLLGTRHLYGLASGGGATHELAGRDNYAFGISLAGTAGGIAIMLTGVTAGDVSPTFLSELWNMLLFSAIGLVLMTLTRFIFDRISLPGYSVREEIGKGNLAVGIVDAGNVLATAIMVRAVMIWASDELVPSLIALGVGYVASQVILSLTTVYRVVLFGIRNPGHHSFRVEIREGNVAISLRYSGFQIGVALAVTAASGLAFYEPGVNPALQAVTWGIVSLVLAVVLIVLARIAEAIVMMGINLAQEVDQQRNLGVGALEVAVYVGIGLLMAGLLGP